MLSLTIWPVVGANPLKNIESRWVKVEALAAIERDIIDLEEKFIND